METIAAIAEAEADEKKVALTAVVEQEEKENAAEAAAKAEMAAEAAAEAAAAVAVAVAVRKKEAEERKALEDAERAATTVRSQAHLSIKLRLALTFFCFP